MEKVKLTLTIDEANELYSLLDNSNETGNEEWDKTMTDIKDKLYKLI